jgi:hypothetical protein
MLTVPGLRPERCCGSTRTLASPLAELEAAAKADQNADAARVFHNSH